MATYQTDKVNTPIAGKSPGAFTDHVLVATLDLAEAGPGLASADIVEIATLPKGAIVYDGFVAGPDVDTGTTEAFEMNVGTVSDADKYLDSGVIDGDAADGYLPAYDSAGCFKLQFNGLAKNGPDALTADTLIRATVAAAPMTSAVAGKLTFVLRFTF